MKLYYSATSPYVRKVHVIAREAGVADRIELAPTVANALQPNVELAKDNPLMKLPTLVTDDGIALFDSPIISQYLVSLPGGAKLLPASGPARWRAMRLEALGDGITDAGMLSRGETATRPEDKRWSAMAEGQLTKVRQGLDMVERNAGELDEPVNIGQISLACGIGWLEFRAVGGDLRAGRPRLFAWYDRFAARPSMAATAPKG